ncbi:Flp pilus assembly protein CpaB [Dendrosporobacter sp. 1207_IL3150]|uniref:Flp pilus assembly protein CpaB n=1 Tax=Dendrosporobacter sp. 1207_IL3150 TaxID=3084054 RepID=UPI002FD8CC8B
MAKLTNKGLLGIALVLSLVTSLLIYNYLKSTANKEVTGIPVIVAKAEIPPKTRITAEMVQETIVPVEYLQPGAVTDINKVIGIVSRERVLAGEQVTERRLVFEGKAVGFTGVIPRDKRALTVAVNEITGVAGFVKPGDYVDIVVTFDAGTIGDNVSQLLLQNILVLASNRDAEEGVTQTANKSETKEPVKATTVTLAVSPDEAARITLADEKGKIRLALRPYLPINGIAVTSTITPTEMVGSHSSPVNTNPSSPTPNFIHPPVYESPKPPASDNSGIKMIRGTKVETVPLD